MTKMTEEKQAKATRTCAESPHKMEQRRKSVV